MHPQVKHSVKHRYEFGPFRLDADDRLLHRDGEVVPLTSKVFDILLVFVANSERTLEKEEVMEQVWPGQFVEEGNLARNVSTLRKALGESSDEHRYIVTIPGRGYRFVAKVREVMDEDGRPIIRSNVTEPLVNGLDESVEAEAPALDRTAASDEEVVETVDCTVKRPSPFTSRRRSIVLVLSALVILIAAVVGLVGWYLRPESAPPVGRAVPLTSYPGFERNPALSPDGNQVAFTWNGVKQDNFDIYIKLIGSSPPLRLTTNPAEDVSPVWSPDGRTIAFLRRLERDRNELLLIPALGGPGRKLTDTLIVDYNGLRFPSLAWSPDSRWLVVSHREDGDLAEGLFLVSTLTGEKRRLTRPAPNFSGDYKPAFSPDGRALAFSRRHGVSLSEVYLLSLSGNYEPAGEARRLQTDGRWARNPVWTRDGRNILYLSRASSSLVEKEELRIIAASGSGRSERVALKEDDISEVGLGRHLVYTRNTGESNIWRAEVPPSGDQAGQPQLLISSTQNDGRPRYSPDGKKIAFGSTRSGTDEIWIADADGSNPMQLTFFGGPLVGYMNWSPDGQRLVFHARPEGQADLFTISTSGGAPKRLTTHPSDDTVPSYSRDGRWIYFASIRSGQFEVWKMPAEGSDATQITSGGGRVAYESPDGKTLYYSHLSIEKGIWKAPAQGGEAIQVTGPIKDPFSFAVAADGIFYVAADSRRQGLIQFLSYATGRSRTVVLTERPIGGGLSLSPDQRFLAFVQRDQDGSDLMLIENFVVR